ncbi:MAG: glycosyltransferase family protein [Candidatus Melainabacteria bacterium]|nr:glycosyltransferase family protein [Candidatus Melainabacteria bacterium]
MPQPTIIIQARMTSSRLPGKVLLPVLDKPLLAYQLERLQRVQSTQRIVVACTNRNEDDPIVALCNEWNLPVFRGSETDVLNRYYEAAQEFEADPIIRITSDCPLIDPAVVDQVIGFYLAHAGQYDYVSNTLERSWPQGLDVEVFAFAALEDADANAERWEEREHVTPYIYWRPEEYRLAAVQAEENHAHYRWTVDTGEDYEFIAQVLETLYPQNPTFTTADVMALLEANPDWLDINAQVHQRWIFKDSTSGQTGSDELNYEDLEDYQDLVGDVVED